MLDFTLSPAQQELRVAARGYAQTHLVGARGLYDHLKSQSERFQSIRPLYRDAVSKGQVKAQIPVGLGGTNSSLVDAAIVLEEIYAADTSVALTIAATGLGLTPLIMSGNAELQTKFIQPFLQAEGEMIASLVHSEPGGTANWLERGGDGLQTTATRSESADGWVINGEKTWTTNSGGWDGKGADLQTVVCRMPNEGNKEDPSSQIIIFLITRDIIAQNDPSSYKIVAEQELLGHSAVSGPHSVFSNFQVPSSNVLASGADAAQLIIQSFGASAALVGAMSVSVMRAAFNEALRFSKTDTRGGSVTLIERQSVANLLMNIKMKADTARLLTWKALHCFESGPGGPEARLELCLEAKVFASDAALEAVTDAMKLVGMTSYRNDHPLARLYQDVVCLPLFDGGNIGIRRRQIEKIMQAENYDPWAAF